MANQDRILRAYARIDSIKKTIPDVFEVNEKWVQEYHSAVKQVSTEIDSDLSEFELNPNSLYRSISSSNYISGEVNYRDGLWCERSVLLQKVEALLTYLQLLLQPPGKKIGF